MSPFSIPPIASTSAAIGFMCALDMVNRYERPTMPAPVFMSTSSSGASPTLAMLVCSGRRIGTTTARTEIDWMLSFILLD